MKPIVNLPPKEPEYLRHFLSFCHRRRYQSKTDIIHPGDPADVLYYLIQGSVAILIEDEDGREIILTYLNKGEFIGEMGLFIPQARRSVRSWTPRALRDRNRPRGK